MSLSPQRVTRQSRSSQRDVSNEVNEDESPVADSSSGIEAFEEINGEDVMSLGNTNSGREVRQRSLLPGRLENKSRTPSPTKSHTDASPKKQIRQKLGDSKPTKSFDEYVRQELKNEAKKTIEDFAKKPKNVTKTKKLTIQGLINDPDTKKLRVVILGVLALVSACTLFVVFWLNRDLRNPESFDESSSVLTTPGATWKRLQKTLFQKFKRLNAQYTHQLSATNIHLLSAVNSTFDVSEPRQPSAITFLIPPSMIHSPFPKCFALEYASAINQMFAETWSEEYQRQDVKVINSKYFRDNTDINKIHEDFKQYFSSGGKVVIVEDVDKLEKEEHFLVFHSFCDNYKAPHKRATFMFLVDVPISVAEKYDWNYLHAADISYSALNEAWTSAISDDHRAAIIARVSATAVLLKDGDSC